MPISLESVVSFSVTFSLREEVRQAVRDLKDLYATHPDLFNAAKLGYTEGYHGRLKPLELVVVNASEEVLMYEPKAQYLNFGKLFCPPNPVFIEPGSVGMIHLCNRMGAMTGVSGAIGFKIGESEKYLYIAYCKPLLGRNTFGVSIQHGPNVAKDVYDLYVDDVVMKNRFEKPYQITACERPPIEYKIDHIQYTIRN